MAPTHAPHIRIAIIGAGQVGSATAHALIENGALSGIELLFVDPDVDKRDAQVQDLGDAALCANRGVRVSSAHYNDAGQCNVIIFAAGAKYTIGQTTGMSTGRNVSALCEVLADMRPIRQDAVIVMVANPVDLLTSLATKLTELPNSQVLGCGTFLDSLRLRELVEDQTGVPAVALDIDVVGVHGDDQVTAWSAATVGGVSIFDAIPPHELDAKRRTELERECKQRSQGVVRARGATPFGVGSVVASIVTSVLQDRRDVRPVSHYQAEYGCSVSFPAVLGRSGIVRTVRPELDSVERAKLDESAKELRRQLDHVLENQSNVY